MTDTKPAGDERCSVCGGLFTSSREFPIYVGDMKHRVHMDCQKRWRELFEGIAIRLWQEARPMDKPDGEWIERTAATAAVHILYRQDVVLYETLQSLDLIKEPGDDLV